MEVLPGGRGHSIWKGLEKKMCPHTFLWAPCYVSGPGGWHCGPGP